MNQVTKRVVCIGGGHCNCQVLKLLRKLIVEQQPGSPKIELTLVSDSAKSYYSGMLPGSVSGLYKDEDIMVHLEPLAKWCKAAWIQQRVVRIEGNANKIHFENGESIDYDVLAINVGSKTKDTGNVKGVWEHSLTTRPINDLLPKIVKKENELKEKGIVPVVAVCGAGAAGTELSFAFKARWTKFFGEEIKVTLIGSSDKPVPEQKEATRQ
jgi:NADH dehydrogenase FAD-containing subunit